MNVYTTPSYDDGYYYAVPEPLPTRLRVRRYRAGGDK